MSRILGLFFTEGPHLRILISVSVNYHLPKKDPSNSVAHNHHLCNSYGHRDRLGFVWSTLAQIDGLGSKMNIEPRSALCVSYPLWTNMFFSWQHLKYEKLSASPWTCFKPILESCLPIFHCQNKLNGQRHTFYPQ